MSKKRRAASRRADSFESSVRLLWGFIGALLIATAGKIFEGSRDSDVWFYALLAVLIVTSYGQGLLAAAYNGFVSGLFFNFFFSSQEQVLSFDSTGDWWLELLFVAVAVVAGLLGRWIPRLSPEPQGRPGPGPKEQGSAFLWKPPSTDGTPREAKEKVWTS